MSDLTQKIDKAMQDLAWIEEQNTELRRQLKIAQEMNESLMRELAIATAELEKRDA